MTRNSSDASSLATRHSHSPLIVDLEAVREAARRSEGIVHRTPVMTCATLDRLAGRSLFFKCENFQKIGAFKFRGAWNAVRQIPDNVAGRGVVTHSSGNHAQALALAAQMRGIPAYIVMPSNATPAKRIAVGGYGGIVTECEPNAESRAAVANEIQLRTGATLISPYDDPYIIAGQGTAALELIEEMKQLDVIVTPIGGGGLVSGTCAAAKGFNPALRVIAAEPAGADDAARSKAEGKLVPQTAPQTIADGLRIGLGKHTWPFVRDLVERVVTVSEEEIIAAMRLTWERAKLLIEPSSAVAVAAVLSEEFKALPGLRRVGVILSGGNVNLDQLPW